MKTKRILLACALSAAVAISLPAPVPAQTDTGTNPDNTRVNKEMRGTESAEQQAETPADRKISQKIRKAVVKNKKLSTYAHNVKIITHDGMVTLKGPVKSEQEKQIVESTAERIAGQGKVTSELEVAPPKK